MFDSISAQDKLSKLTGVFSAYAESMVNINKDMLRQTLNHGVEQVQLSSDQMLKQVELSCSMVGVRDIESCRTWSAEAFQPYLDETVARMQRQAAESQRYALEMADLGKLWCAGSMGRFLKLTEAAMADYPGSQAVKDWAFSAVSSVSAMLEQGSAQGYEAFVMPLMPQQAVAKSEKTAVARKKAA